MSANTNIFSTLPVTDSISSPFSFAGDAVVANSPFSMPTAAQSPFSAMPDDSDSQQNFPEPGKPAKIPPPRNHSDKASRIFPDNTVPFGYEALSGALPQQPYAFPQHAEAQAHAHHFPAPTASPFGAAFGSTPPQVPVQAQPVAGYPNHHQSFADHQDAQMRPHAAAATVPGASPFSIVSPVAPTPLPVEQQPQFVPASQPHASVHQPAHESTTMMQLELRAIFGLDRDLTVEEILQRCRSLPGVRNIARITSRDIAAMDVLKQNLAGLGFGSGGLRLYIGNAPIEFITEDSTTLAIHTDGGFAPGIRETLIIVARQLNRMA